MKFLSGFVCLCVLVTAALPVESRAEQTEPSATFNAEEAWAEFESLFRLFYAYIERDDFSADATLEGVRGVATATDNAADFRDVLNTMLYAWTDNHLALQPLTSEFNVVPSGADLILKQRGDDLVVQDVRAGSAAAEASVRPGWIVELIDGVPAREAAMAVFGGLVETPTRRQLEHVATVAVNGRPGAAREIRFINPAGTRVVKSLASPSSSGRSEAPLTLHREGDIAVVRLNNSLGNNDTIHAFDEAIVEAADAAALIIDLRDTPGGGNTEVARSILGHFVDETRSYQVHEIPSLEREFTVPRRFIEQVKPREPQFTDRPVVVLAGYWTGSMGEGLVIGFDAATDAHIIASDMADLLGGMMTLDLQHSSATLRLGRESLFHVDGTPREMFVAEHSLESADTGASGEDPAMTAALLHIRGHIQGQ